jgi:DNA gyrase inhibitor GyrI
MREFLGSQGIHMDTKNSVGFCWDNKWFTPLDVCRYECGYQIESLAWAKERGIAARTRPSGRYLIIEYITTSPNTENFYLWLLSEYLPSTNYASVMPFVVENYINVRCQPDVFHFEVQIKIQ